MGGIGEQLGQGMDGRVVHVVVGCVHCVIHCVIHCIVNSITVYTLTIVAQEQQEQDNMGKKEGREVLAMAMGMAMVMGEVSR